MKKNIVVAFVVCLMAGIAVTACGDIETGIPNGDCFNGEKKNDDNGGKLICKEGKWVKDGAEVGYVCTEENSENSENSEAGKLIKPDGKEEYCIIDGQKVSCKSESECGECLNGSKKPDNYICENGKWVKESTEVGNVCTDENSENSEAGKLIKPDGKEEYCIIDGQKVSCKSESECGECLNGASECRKNMNYICEDGRWKKTEEVCGGNVCIEEKNSQIGSVKNEKCLSGGEFVSCNKDKSDCGVCLNGKYKCEEVGKDRKICEHGEWKPSEKCDCDKIGTISGDKKGLCIDYKWMKCSNWGDVVENRACLYKDKKLWYECNASEEKQGPAVDDKLLCNKNVWYECKSDAHLNAVVDKMACVKIDGVYKWTKM